MKKLIISGFAGIGKTYLEKNYINTIDLESGIFQYNIKTTESHESQKGDHSRELDPNWLEKYLNAIEIARSSEYIDVICVAQFPELVKGMQSRNIQFIMVLPELDCKDDYRNRYISRGNRQSWVDNMIDRYDMFIEYNKKYAEKNNIPLLWLKKSETLVDLLNNNYPDLLKRK